MFRYNSPDFRLTATTGDETIRADTIHLGAPAEGYAEREALGPASRRQHACAVWTKRMSVSFRRVAVLTVGAALIWLYPSSSIAQGHRGLVTLSAPPTLTISELRQRDALIEHMVRDAELVRRAISDDRLLPNRQHERFTQYHRGVPVYGGDISRQTAGGVTVSIFGSIYTQIDLDLTPGLSAHEAAAILENESGARLVGNTRPTLTILPTLDGGYALTYRALLGNARTYFLDAHTGQVLIEIDEIKSQSAVGLGTGVWGDAKKVSATQVVGFVAQDLLRPARIRTLDTRGSQAALDRLTAAFAWARFSDNAADSDNTWTDGAVVDAHVQTGWVYDYFFKRHGRNGLNGENGAIFGVVHRRPSRRSGLLNNAAFLRPPFGPGGGGVMLYGETDRGAPVVALDVVAHELMHGVTHFSARLASGLFLDGVGPFSFTYRGRVFSCGSTTFYGVLARCDTAGRFVTASSPPGAINEAFSDMTGVSVEFFFQETGAGPLTADYLIGEDIPGMGTFRRIDSPRVLSINSSGVSYPDHFRRRLRFVVVEGGIVDPWVFLDGTVYFVRDINGGAVHWNSTILSHAFYLAIEGGRNSTSRRTVQGVGGANREEVERVFFRAMTGLMPRFPTLPLAATVIRRSAIDLFGSTSAVSRAVSQALLAVGL